MGIVIRFPQERRLERSVDAQPLTGSATIIILPVVRTERHVDTAPDVRSMPTVPRGARPRSTRRRVAVLPAV